MSFTKEQITAGLELAQPEVEAQVDVVVTTRKFLEKHPVILTELRQNRGGFSSQTSIFGFVSEPPVPGGGVEPPR